MKLLDYKGKLALAPMVRVSELPLRKLCLQHGADLVWGPEVVDKGIINSTRKYNEQLRTVDFISNADPTKIVFRTQPELEKSRLVFQLGSADADLAVQAAKCVAQDVSAVDLNCGCPMHFSVHSGMGSQLLKNPDNLCKILESLVEKVGKPFGIAISAKIRLLENAAKTCELVARLVRTGISCLTVHCRTIPQRPREPAFYDYLPGVVKLCRENGVACFVNGDIKDRAMLDKLIEQYGVDGGMIARAAQANPLTCFQHLTGEAQSAEQQDLQSLRTSRAFYDACVEFDYNKAHTKYNLAGFISGKSPLFRKITGTRTMEDIGAVIAEAESLNAAGAPIKRTPRKLRKLEGKLESSQKGKPRAPKRKRSPNDTNPTPEAEAKAEAKAEDKAEDAVEAKDAVEDKATNTATSDATSDSTPSAKRIHT